MDTPKLVPPTTVLLTLLLAACASPPPASPSVSPAPSSPSATAAPSPSAADSPGPPASPLVLVKPAAPMLRARVGFDAVTLGDGTILVVGDDQACYPGPAVPGSETAERYDPAADRWTEAESLNKPRKSFATVVMRDGRAMVLGGINADEQPFSSTKIFDPNGGSWSDGPLLERAIGEPAAAVLGDGRIMALRPRTFGETGYASAVELLDPGREAWGSGEEVDMWVTGVVTLEDGGVLARGGAFESPELLYRYEPSAGRWSIVDSPVEIVSSLDYGRFGQLVPLGDGSVLALNVAPSSSDPFPSVRVSRLDPASGEWSTAASMSTARDGAAVTVLTDGRVLVAGGAVYADDGRGGRAVAATEIYDPVADRWSPGPDLLEPRKDAAGLLLPDGSVLILGGDASFNTMGDVPWCPDPMTSVERLYIGS